MKIPKERVRRFLDIIYWELVKNRKIAGPRFELGTFIQQVEFYLFLGVSRAVYEPFATFPSTPVKRPRQILSKFVEICFNPSSNSDGSYMENVSASTPGCSTPLLLD